MGMAWAGSSADRVKRVAAELLRAQRADGGWAQRASLGVVLRALCESWQLKAGDAAYRKGADYLLRTQLEDGSWYVRSRAMKLQPYFQSGFPHDHDQWISYSATADAVTALAGDGM